MKRCDPARGDKPGRINPSTNFERATYLVMTDTKRKRRSAAGKYRVYQDRSMRTAAWAVPPPDWVLEEREQRLAAAEAELSPGEAHLGSPPPSRSALKRERKSRFSERFLLRTWGEA